MKHTENSLKLTQDIAKKIDGGTFHHHYYVLYDIANLFPEGYHLIYVEIGCYAGGSACLMLQRPNTKVISIDLGTPMPKSLVYSNVEKLNIHSNEYNYLEGNSQSYEMVDKLKLITEEIDILFIDGDHSYQGVINDFLLYEKFVKKGGYIIFDDYNDPTEVHNTSQAVNDIITRFESNYEIIGTVDNIYRAHPEWLKNGNDFIIKKL
jgi:predicted O-methyltransferase YrrM